MRKVMVWGFVLVAVGLLFTGAQAQRIAPSPVPDAPTKTAQQVEVVGGTVDVGNLPLDGDGNLRVAGQSYRWIQVADQVPLTPGIPYTFGPFDVAGWRTATFLWGPAPTLSLTVQYGGDGFFATEGTVNNNTGRQIFPTDVHGPQAQVIVAGSFAGTTLTMWLYLSN